MTTEMMLLCFFAELLILFEAFADEEHHPVMLGGDATLQCQAPRGAVITVLEWSKTDLSSDDYVFFYRNDRSYEKYQHPSFRGRVELLEPSMKDGDVSVVLKNVTVNDAGTYRCRIIMSSTGNSDRVFSEDRLLRVTEPDHREEVGEAVGRLGKAIQKPGSGNAGGGQSVAAAVGVGAVCVLFIVALNLAVFKKDARPRSQMSLRQLMSSRK
ncbi:coxsackievirus and adenovirus receptor homolog [Archocentrus centrarchus]|uniref:coxsackievirus and adenovirus receptor homolog n=1 Tax=Archocentrus centrarchus TaxID=63155 RepID=UPI0011E9F50A|nr:coxsackievirus and adenovirus receptor homolog [Archocentrus centrarchus]